MTTPVGNEAKQAAEQRESGETPRVEPFRAELITANSKLARAERELADLRSRLAACERERDEADRRAGNAERRLSWATDDQQKRGQWLSKAKEAWGVHDNVSFDVVWEEALALRSRAEQAEAALDRLADAADLLAADQSHATHPAIGLVQPISVEEGQELCDAIESARTLLSALCAATGKP